MKIKILFVVSYFLCITFANILAQGKLYEGPDDPASDPAAERFAWHSGNRLNLFFRNTTEIGGAQVGVIMSRWPNNFDGQRMHDGIATIIGARVYIKNDSIPVENPASYNGGEHLDSVYFAQSSFYHFMDENPEGTVEWGLHPVYGYFNDLDEYPAMSNLTNSWPTEGWPSNNGVKWQGEWNGRFGRGIMKADQESFVVANDAQDQENLPGNPLNDSLYYFPRRIYGNNGEIMQDIKIGDKYPDVTVQKGMHWGGLGIRIEQRAFQWNNPSVQDAIFFEYTIANISEYDISDVYFAYFLDNGPGGEDADAAYFDKKLNLCYSWDYDGFGYGGGKGPGIVGFAFLESPGAAFDGIDNDEDGLIDEKRDNLATSIIGPTDGISNLNDFLSFYNLEEGDLKEHWDADEDQDWQDGYDANGNGTYTYFESESHVWQVEPGERVGDDVGLDGVGPYDLNYNGPDADGSEGNQRPDYVEGLGSEPNFASTDVSESDMLGLTSFRYELDYTSDRNSLSADEVLFRRLTEGVFDESVNEPQNIIEQFASGLFPLYKGRSERISMSEFHSYDPLAGLNSSEHLAPALFRLKGVVQTIYEADYRFAQPPLMPTLTATPLDGKIVLSWDDVSDRFTREAFLKNTNDFEGYKLFRSTDNKLADAEQITDGFGSPFLKRPIFQCDLIDDIQGFADFAPINGALFNLGYDSGLKHYFVDNTVENGRTYYYVLVAYDYGIDSTNIKIPPSENTFILELDEYENIRKVSQNVAIVNSHQYAAGYQEADIEQGSNQQTLGTGWANAELLLPSKIKDGHEYKIKFGIELLESNSRVPMAYLYRNDAIRIYDITEGDKLVYEETKLNFAGNNFKKISRDIYAGDRPNFIMNTGTELETAEFDGLLVRFYVPYETAQYDKTNSGWINGSSPINIGIAETIQPGGEQKDMRLLTMPYEYDIVFTENDSVYVTNYTWSKIWREEEADEITYKDEILRDQNYSFYVVNRSVQDEEGNDIIMDMVGIDRNENGEYDILIDEIFVGTTYTNIPKWGGTAFTIDFTQSSTEGILPEAGDVYHISFERPFMESDSIMFTVNAAEMLESKEKLNEDMEQIKVVPNPYVVTNTFETNVANFRLSQRRKLMFTHIPAESTIRIFTVSGVLVDVIEVNNSVSNRETPWDLNSESNGTVFWDLKSREGLDVAAGYYMYHVRSHVTGKEKMGKFAVIK